MSQIELSHDAFARGRAAVARAAEDLAEHRVRIDRQVAGLVGSGWSGGAAEAFWQSYDEWRAGADDVHAGLAAMADLLDAARSRLEHADETAHGSLERVSQRLLTRLGR